jgi:hypothetical protein
MCISIFYYCISLGGSLYILHLLYIYIYIYIRALDPQINTSAIHNMSHPDHCLLCNQEVEKSTICLSTVCSQAIFGSALRLVGPSKVVTATW